MDNDTSTFRPPYMPFQTFWRFVEDLAEKPLPPRIDRSLMSTKSGTDQANLTMALNSFGLTSEDGTVQPALADLVAFPADERKTKFGDFVRQYYEAPLAVSAQNGTEVDLRNAFQTTWPSIGSADTRRKAITFFLHAARAAEIPLSPHFPTTRSGSGAPGQSKPRRVTPKRKNHSDNIGTPPAPPAAPTSKDGHSQVVKLKSGGTVTLSYNVSLFDLDATDQRFVLDLVQKVKDYAAGQPTPLGGDDADEGGAS